MPTLAFGYWRFLRRWLLASSGARRGWFSILGHGWGLFDG